MTNLAVAANGLRKSYGDKVVLDGIDLHVAEETIFSLLGLNGAGKTTTVQILSTLIGADGGEVGVGAMTWPRTPRKPSSTGANTEILTTGHQAHGPFLPYSGGTPSSPTLRDT